jgi:hypothetical protein
VSLTKADAALLERRAQQPARVPGEVRVFVAGQLTNPMNGSRGHWTKHAKWASLWRDRTGLILFDELSRVKAPWKADAPKAVTFVCFVAREWDDDNVRAACKPLRDALKDMKLIDDDKPSTGHVFAYTQIIDGKRTATRGVEIRVRAQRGDLVMSDALGAAQSLLPQEMPDARSPRRGA